MTGVLASSTHAINPPPSPGQEIALAFLDFTRFLLERRQRGCVSTSIESPPIQLTSVGRLPCVRLNFVLQSAFRNVAYPAATRLAGALKGFERTPWHEDSLALCSIRPRAARHTWTGAAADEVVLTAR